MENEGQEDQAAKKKEGQSLDGSNSPHPLKNDVTVSVSRVRSLCHRQFVENLYFTMGQKSSTQDQHRWKPDLEIPWWPDTDTINGHAFNEE